MGSCCSYRTKSNRKSNEIINLPSAERPTKVIIVNPKHRPVPQLKKLQNNPLYKKRRRKSMTDAKLSIDSLKTADSRKKRLTTDVSTIGNFKIKGIDRGIQLNVGVVKNKH